MVVFPNCKLNIGLYITEKRSDGYHNLETVFVPLPLTDCLEIIPSNDFQFQSSGLPIAGTNNNNLCVKAYQLLKQYHPQMGSLHMHLHKIIPMGAGLGGGSADGAFALMAMNKQFNLQLTDNELKAYALQLGSDCPFFIENKPCFANGRGENLTPINLLLKGYSCWVINPQIHVSTAWAFAQIQPQKAEVNLVEAIQQPMNEWKKYITNQFQEPVAKSYPAIAEIVATLYQQGAVYAAMTGSGSTVYGIFESSVEPSFSFPANYWVKQLTFN